MMDSEKGKEFNVYKGLQRPLVFKSLKGKFIYWGMACILLAFMIAVILATVVNAIVGVIGLLVIGLGGLSYINSKQKKGLHNKTKSAGTYIVPPQFKRAFKQ